VAGLLRAACGAQKREEIRLIQALVEPHKEQELRLLEAAGFVRLAKLIYMQKRAPRTEAKLELPEGIIVEHYSAATHARFARAIAASYEQTLDCPGLVGLRGIEDVIAGHQAAGQFEAGMWYALRAGDDPVGVMLLNLSAEGDAVELVYLGLAPRWRGQGLARKLLEHGLWAGRSRGATRMVLAVDDGNQPALALYGAMKFTATTQRWAMIYVVA
jgi:mycothiol synthase